MTSVIARRYRMLPTLYSAFREGFFITTVLFRKTMKIIFVCFISNIAHKIGAPVVRPLFFADPCDPALRDADSGFLLGEGEN